MLRTTVSLLLAAALTAPPSAAAEEAAQERKRHDETAVPAAFPAAEEIAAAVKPPLLADLVRRVLAGNPAVAAAEARARAAAERAPQAGALPDPTAMVTAFLSAPETRVGPQRLAVSVAQALPWLSKLGDRERRALWEAAAARAEAEATRLAALTETRRLFFEIAFLDEAAAVLRGKREHLLQHEEAARARYATGVGESQGVVKLQAEITRAEAELLALETRRSRYTAALAALAGGPGEAAPLPPLELPALAELPVPEAADFSASGRLAPEALLAAAEAHRPEVAAAAARVEAARLGSELATRERRPDFTVGLTYTLVDPRSDAAGLANPPQRNGADVFGLQGGVRIPLWHRRLAAAVEEAAAEESAAGEMRRQAVLEVGRQLDQVTAALPLHRRRAELLEEVLVLQAEEALRSAEAGYVAGRFSALDLLDAEHVLFDTLTAAARARADVAVALAELEGALGAPLASLEGGHP